MPRHTTDHIYETPWDAPFDAVRIAYSFTPGTPDLGPSLNDPGEPGEPDDVVPLLCRAKVGGVWEDQSERVLQVMAALLRDDMIAEAREDRAERRAYARSETREAA